jgi:uncharacterized protein YecE (DUF72 family)
MGHGHEGGAVQAHRPAELAEWVTRVRPAVEEAREVHLLCNNCCADAAVRAAESMHRPLVLPAGEGRD